MRRITVGIVGCGNISSVYMENIPKFKNMILKACADLDIVRAKHQAEKYKVPHAYSVEEILQDNEIDLIVNLTIPKAHAEVSRQALLAGKHVYVEKPFTVTLEEGREILQIAEERGLLVGSAPDTFLGAGIQTVVKLIENGEIGLPIGASAFMIGRGHEHWHPDPAFYYEEGGGPMFDMGPYYLTALIAMLGPMKRIAGSARISYPEREILSEPRAGEIIQVKTPTHLSGTIEFSSGAIGTMITSFDAFGGSSLPHIEIYGSEGTILVPDPNTFGGPVKIRKKDQAAFQEVPLVHSLSGNERGLGVADMADAVLNEGEHRASGNLGFHVLEAMYGFHESSEKGIYYEMESTCIKPSIFEGDGDE